MFFCLRWWERCCSHVAGWRWRSLLGHPLLNLQSQKFAPDRVIVKLKEGASSRALEERNRGIGARTEKRIAPHTVPRLHTVKLPQGVSVERAIEHYKASRDVEYAEPDFFVYHDATTTDPYYTDGSLWGLNNTGQNSGTNDADVDAPEAWNVVDTTNDEEIVVAVIDEGVDYNHPDLAGNIWKNPGETGTDSQGRNKETNGVDDDGNRYVDDVRGYDFYYKTSTTMITPPTTAPLTITARMLRAPSVLWGTPLELWGSTTQRLSS